MALQRLRHESVDADELQDAKEYTKGNLLLAGESVDNMMVRLAQNEIHFGRYFGLKEILEQIEAVTVEELQALARDLFLPDLISLTLLGAMPADWTYDHLIQ